MNWNEYQEKTASLFREAGLHATTNQKIQSARTNFNIDVYVEFIKDGFKQIWIIECKFWNKKISKDKVATLQTIMQEIGANKGIIVTEKGYQIGAKELANNTAIELVTFEELEEKLKSSIQQVELEKLIVRAKTLFEEIHIGFYPEEAPLYTAKRPGVDEDSYKSISTRLRTVLDAVEPPLLGRKTFPRTIMLDPKLDLDDPTNWAKNLDELLNKANIIVNEIEPWWLIQKNAIENLKKSGWVNEGLNPFADLIKSIKKKDDK